MYPPPFSAVSSFPFLSPPFSIPFPITPRADPFIPLFSHLHFSLTFYPICTILFPLFLSSFLLSFLHSFLFLSSPFLSHSSFLFFLITFLPFNLSHLHFCNHLFSPLFSLISISHPIHLPCSALPVFSSPFLYYLISTFHLFSHLHFSPNHHFLIPFSLISISFLLFSHSPFLYNHLNPLLLHVFFSPISPFLFPSHQTLSHSSFLFSNHLILPSISHPISPPPIPFLSASNACHLSTFSLISFSHHFSFHFFSSPFLINHFNLCSIHLFSLSPFLSPFYHTPTIHSCLFLLSISLLTYPIRPSSSCHFFLSHFSCNHFLSLQHSLFPPFLSLHFSSFTSHFSLISISHFSILQHYFLFISHFHVHLIDPLIPAFFLLSISLQPPNLHCNIHPTFLSSPFLTPACFTFLSISHITLSIPSFHPLPPFLCFLSHLPFSLH
ncbi:unnamed protein product [Acanthosepion pharaonis]|uniref:Uncharacterized protein n=1 Tax=Acanthosepion pharaonis TaxID=158019 RepID=A0A812DDH8_ACAPH|nr:unnamed protein product [Sepia pharaonis]